MLDQFHVDGLRVDAVASMLYLDYSRANDQWIPNAYGGRENLEAIYFLKRVNEVCYERFPGIMTIAEESTAWPGVSRPTHLGGLGFGFKWNMGWMHDFLHYMSREPIFRRYHQNEITFSLLYAFQEQFMLVLSHDEVVHGKGSLINKMPGDTWQKFANLRLLYAWMYGPPGKKLLFMVTHGEDLPFSPVVSFQRISKAGSRIVFVVNATPVVREGYRIGVSQQGFYREVLNTDAQTYGGSNQGNYGGVWSEPHGWQGQGNSIVLKLPPLSVVAFSCHSS